MWGEKKKLNNGIAVSDMGEQLACTQPVDASVKATALVRSEQLQWVPQKQWLHRQPSGKLLPSRWAYETAL